MFKLLFGQSYYLRFDPKLWAAMQPYPPLGTLYAAAYMRQQGHQVAIFDAMLAQSEQAWAAALSQEKPDIAIIYEDNFNYLSKMCLLRMRQAAYTMIQMAKQQHCLVIIAGSDATDHATAYLQQGADFVLLGEGEATLAELLEQLDGRSPTPLHQIAGLAYYQPNSNPPLLRQSRRPDLTNLDALPFPAWDLINVEQYRQIWLAQHGYYSMNMVTTRGCPYHCNWCAKPIWGQRYNTRSPENVVAEMKWLKQTYSPDHIWFADDIMGLKPGWLEQMAQQVEAHQASIPFKCLSRADLLLRGKTIQSLKKAGCTTLWIGAESGSQQILNAMEKGTKVEQIYTASQKVRQAGIQIGFFLQFGYPGETREDIEQTLQMVRDCQPDDIGISVSYPLPGTKFYERVKMQLGEKQNWQDSSDLAMMYQGPFTTDFYRQLHLVLHKEFRWRKTWRAWPTAVSQPRRILAMIYHRATLPLARHKLNQLAQIQATSTISLSPELSLEEAAAPSKQ